ncbi:response regulator transcription factor [Saccharopolyspora shandongensis]|uniref:response regulator transcription factor n=1 Tax=Saccharopolyspora shandongensis TaxID=418495 RepID=UPI003F4CDE16
MDAVYDGAAALERCVSADHDVVVLDRGLPLVHGDEVCRSLIAERRETRILLLTAASAVADRVAGLELGADDYLPKPFAFTELVARVRSLGRRSRPAVPPILQRAGIVLDPARHRVTRHDHPISLTKKQFTVLEEWMALPASAGSASRMSCGPTYRPPGPELLGQHLNAAQLDSLVRTAQ